MVEIISPFAQHVGALVLNLAERGLIVRVATENRILGGKVLTLKLTLIKGQKTKQIVEYISEPEMVDIPDIGTVADALYNKVREQP